MKVWDNYKKIYNEKPTGAIIVSIVYVLALISLLITLIYILTNGTTTLVVLTFIISAILACGSGFWVYLQVKRLPD